MTWTKEREDWIRECVSRNPEMETVEGHDWRGRAADLLSWLTAEREARQRERDEAAEREGRMRESIRDEMGKRREAERERDEARAERDVAVKGREHAISVQVSEGIRADRAETERDAILAQVASMLTEIEDAYGAYTVQRMNAVVRVEKALLAVVDDAIRAKKGAGRS